MNIAEAQDVKHFLLQSHDQYRELAERHHALDDRLHELTVRPHLSETEQAMHTWTRPDLLVVVRADHGPFSGVGRGGGSPPPLPAGRPPRAPPHPVGGCDGGRRVRDNELDLATCASTRPVGRS